MSLSLSAAFSATAMPSALASPGSTGIAIPAGGLSTGSAEPMGLTALTLRERAVPVVANQIQWAPWRPDYTSDHRWTGTWLNMSI